MQTHPRITYDSYEEKHIVTFSDICHVFISMRFKLLRVYNRDNEKLLKKGN